MYGFKYLYREKRKVLKSKCKFALYGTMERSKMTPKQVEERKQKSKSKIREESRKSQVVFLKLYTSFQIVYEKEENLEYLKFWKESKFGGLTLIKPW